MAPKERAVWLLGAAQCVYWGILYYAFAVLLVPMRADLQASDAVLAGAFSVGLASWALLSARMGVWLDRGRGRAMLRGGGLAAAVLLLAWSWVESPAGLYLVWAGLGASMAALLYETAFGLVTRAFAEPAARLNALARITILGGLASTIFVPLVAAGVGHLGWRPTVRCLAALVLLTAWLLERVAVRHLDSDLPAEPARQPSSGTADSWRAIAILGAPFVVATFAAMALTALAIPTLVDRGHSLSNASWVLATLGISQLPGRLWLSRSAVPPRVLLVAPLVLQALGLVILGSALPFAATFGGVALVGIGAGLHTLARPWVVPQLYGAAAAGRINGAIARMQGVARAAGPFASFALYSRFGSGPVFVGLAVALLLTLPWALRTAERATVPRPQAHPAAFCQEVSVMRAGPRCSPKR